MDKAERIKAHDLKIPEGYLPRPHSHLGNPRDAFHYSMTVEKLQEGQVQTVLDVGCFDGWLDFLLIDKGFKVTGLELIKALADAAKVYASRNFYQYKIYQGFFDEVEVTESFDAVICFETLEHIALSSLGNYLEKLESLAKKMVLISLPNEDYEKNPQHLWTPTKDLIGDLWSDRKDFFIKYKDYPNTDIPGNWFISYRVD